MRCYREPSQHINKHSVVVCGDQWSHWLLALKVTAPKLMATTENVVLNMQEHFGLYKKYYGIFEKSVHSNIKDERLFLLSRLQAKD